MKEFIAVPEKEKKSEKRETIVAIANEGWDESKHKRAKDGKFGAGGTSAQNPKSGKGKKPKATKALSGQNEKMVACWALADALEKEKNTPEENQLKEKLSAAHRDKKTPELSSDEKAMLTKKLGKLKQFYAESLADPEVDDEFKGFAKKTTEKIDKMLPSLKEDGGGSEKPTKEKKSKDKGGGGGGEKKSKRISTDELTPVSEWTKEPETEIEKAQYYLDTEHFLDPAGLDDGQISMLRRELKRITRVDGTEAIDPIGDQEEGYEPASELEKMQARIEADMGFDIAGLRKEDLDNIVAALDHFGFNEEE
jgi:hypothetical protein